MKSNSFSITTPSHWIPEGSGEIVDKLFELLELTSQKDIEISVKEVEKRGTRIRKETSGYNLAGFDDIKSETPAELKTVKYKDLEDLVQGIELNYEESLDIKDVNHIAGSNIGYILQPGIF